MKEHEAKERLTALNHGTNHVDGEIGEHERPTLLPTLSQEARAALLEMVATRPTDATLVRKLVQAADDTCSETP
jgi:hypothetical protein